MSCSRRNGRPARFLDDTLELREITPTSFVVLRKAKADLDLKPVFEKNLRQFI